MARRRRRGLGSLRQKLGRQEPPAPPPAPSTRADIPALCSQSSRSALLSLESHLPSTQHPSSPSGTGNSYCQLFNLCERTT